MFFCRWSLTRAGRESLFRRGTGNDKMRPRAEPWIGRVNHPCFIFATILRLLCLYVYIPPRTSSRGLFFCDSPPPLRPPSFDDCSLFAPIVRATWKIIYISRLFRRRVVYHHRRRSLEAIYAAACHDLAKRCIKTEGMMLTFEGGGGRL